MDEILQKIREIVQIRFQNESADHDFQHIERVVKTAIFLQKHEGGDEHVIIAAAYLHDISDHKLNGGKLNDGAREARLILEELNAAAGFTDQVCAIIDAVSFKGAKVADNQGSIELQIVRDADRLDAIGAIGIARAFHFGGSRNRPFFLPDVPPVLHDSFESYVKGKSHTINHFYEKLLLLKDRLATPTAQKIAFKKQQVMEDFLHAFHSEWNGDYEL